jgi:hypothetical protein
MSRNSLAGTIIAKSDQLNADDMVAGPITVEITGVEVAPNPNSEQPVILRLSGGFRPWKPCKTMRRVLVRAWGEDGDVYVKRRLTLFRDDRVKWAGEAVGGIRISHMSDISGTIEISLANSKGKKGTHRITPLSVEAGGSVDPFRAALIAATRRAEAPWTLEQIQQWLLGGRKAADIRSYERPAILERLQGPPAPLVAPEEEL